MVRALKRYHAGTMRYAGFLRRLLASLIDWVIAFFLPALAMSYRLPQDAPDELILLWVALPLVYFTWFVSRGQTPGMAILRMRLVRASDGGRPGLWRALLRTATAVALGVSIFLLAVFGFSDRPGGGYSTFDGAVFVAIAAGFGFSVAGHLWALVDRQRRTWQDRISGVIAVRMA